MDQLYGVVDIFFQILWWLVIARIVLSWVPNPPDNQFMRLLYQVTDPILTPFQRLIPPIGMIDISPMVALFALQLIRNLVLGLISRGF